MANTVDKVISIAKGEVGYLEKSRAAYISNPACLDDKTKGAGSDNYTKYGRDMHALYPAVMDFPAAWCDCFVDWCFQKAYGVSNAKTLLAGNFDDYTVNSAQMYKNKGAYYKSSPKVGDQIFFRNSQRICHTGLVIAVTSTTVTTIEGNTSSAAGVVANGGCVRQKTYSINYSGIDGYGRPAYDKVGTSIKPAVVPQPVKSNQSYKVGKTYTTQVDLNVRTGAGTQYDKKKYNALTADGKKHAYSVNGGYGVLKSGTAVTCKAVLKDNFGNTWIQIPSGYVAACYDGKVYIK